MNTIQVRIDFDTKLQLMRDAEANKMTLSTLMRRLINLYLTDESVRQKVQIVSLPSEPLTYKEVLASLTTLSMIRCSVIMLTLLPMTS